MALDLQSRLAGLRAQFPSQSEAFDHGLAALDALSREQAALPVSANDTMVQQVQCKAAEYVQAIERLTSAWTERVADHEASELLFLSSQLAGAVELLPRAAIFPQSDLFSQAENSPRWTQLADVVSYVSPTQPEELQKGIEKIGNQLIYGNAVVSKGFEFTHKRTKEVVIGAGLMLYNLDKERMRGQALKNYAKPRKESILALWNSVDSVLMAPLAMRGLADVPLSRIIFLPRTVAPVLSQAGPAQGCRDATFSEEAAEDRVPVKVVAPFVLPGLKPKEASWWQHCCGGRREPDGPVKSCSQVIIHAHGGGFIAMTSRPHQSYIRQWALRTQTPILCVDYRLAPEYPFPAALDDVWQTYHWVLQHGEDSLGIKPEKVILAGDSAGGNLVLGVVMRAIEVGARVPDGVLLAYPSLCLRADYFTPSYLLALDDLILHHTFCKLCGDLYVPPHWDRRDKYVSPLCVEDEQLQKFPPVRIVIGNKDPLHDDCWRLTERLRDLHRDVHMTVFTGLVHGGMNFYLRNDLKDGIRMVDQSAAYLSYLLGNA